MSRRFLPCFGLSRVLVFGGVFGLFVSSLFADSLRLSSPCRGCRLSVLSVLSVCLCVPVSVAGSHPVAGRVWLSGLRTSVRLEPVEQVFETNVRLCASGDIPMCRTESNRIFANRILSFFNRILTESLLWVLNRIFDWLVASSGVA